MWHVSSRSGVATLRTAIHLLLTSPAGGTIRQETLHQVLLIMGRYLTAGRLNGRTVHRGEGGHFTG